MGFEDPLDADEFLTMGRMPRAYRQRKKSPDANRWRRNRRQRRSVSALALLFDEGDSGGTEVPRRVDDTWEKVPLCAAQDTAQDTKEEKWWWTWVVRRLFFAR